MEKIYNCLFEIIIFHSIRNENYPPNLSTRMIQKRKKMPRDDKSLSLICSLIKIERIVDLSERKKKKLSMAQMR